MKPNKSGFKRLILSVLLIFGMQVSGARAEVKVFVAASLAQVVEAIGQDFSEQNGTKIAIVPAGSSTLAQQIVAGAPADIFISANSTWIDFVSDKTRFGAGVALFSNSLVVIAPNQSGLTMETLADLPLSLGPARLALGNPEHVPAGIYAKEALLASNVWKEVENQLAPTSNVRAALRLVQAGAAPLGIVYATDVAGANVEIVHQIDTSLHQKIIYLAAVTADANEETIQFFAYLQSELSLKRAVEFGFVRIKE